MGCASSKETPTVEVNEPTSREAVSPAAAPAPASSDAAEEAELLTGLPESPQSKPSQKALQPPPDEDGSNNADVAKAALEEVRVEITNSETLAPAADTVTKQALDVAATIETTAEQVDTTPATIETTAEQVDATPGTEAPASVATVASEGEAVLAEQLAGEVVAKVISEAIASVNEDASGGTLALRGEDAGPSEAVVEQRRSIVKRVSDWASGMLSPRLSLSPQPKYSDAARDRAESKIKTKKTDVGDNGHLSQSDFDSIRRSKKASAAFKKIDKNGDGRLSRAEVIQALRKDPEVRKLLGLEEFETIRQEDGSRDAFEKVFQALDADSNKMIDEREFCRFFVRGVAEYEAELSGKELAAPRAIQ